MDHHSLDCCNSNRGADNLFNNYKKNIDIICNLVTNEPNKLTEIMWKQESPFCIDVNCRCCMGEGERRSPFSCSQCKNISNIKDFRQSDLTFKIQCGSNTGKQMIILPHKVSNLFICNDDNAYDKYKSYMIQNDKAHEEIKFISSDPFTNRILLMSTINKIFKDKKLPHTINFYTAFICGDKGYTMLEEPTIGSFGNLPKIPEYEKMCSPLLPKITKTIITQLVITLNELSYIKFSHGNPSIESLAFGSERVSYKYEGININGDITLKIANFWKSSATFSKTRYFSHDIKSELHLECNILIPKIQTCISNNNEYYKIGNNDINMLMIMNNITLSTFLGSFDLYCFFVSLMCNQSFYMSVIANNDIYLLWQSLWLSEDLDKINKLICNHHSSDVNNFETTVNIISNFWLRCDATKHLLVLIKKK